MLEEKKITKVLSENKDDIFGEVVTDKYSDGRVVHTYYHLECNHRKSLANAEWSRALFLRGKKVEDDFNKRFYGKNWKGGK